MNFVSSASGVFGVWKQMDYLIVQLNMCIFDFDVLNLLTISAREGDEKIDLIVW